jgi:serine/threonine protein kinase
MAQVDLATCEEAVCNEDDASQAGSFEMEDKPSGASSFSSTEQRTSFDSTASSAGASSSPYFSTRCQSMMQRRTEFPSELDFKIQVSKEHWSELSTVEDRCAARKKPVPLGVVIARGFGKAFLGRKIVAEDDDATTTPELHSSESLERTREVFERLKREQHSFFQDFADLELGGKIAEGGQAEIFEARCSMRSCDGSFSPTECVVKVMKEGFSVQSLQSQWSPKLRRRLSQSKGCGETLAMTDASVHGTGTSSIIGGTLLQNGRFAFVLDKYCGDLRNLIDLRMQEKGNHGPPFDERVAVRIIGQVARGMYTLHKSNILHRDLKASNVLVERFSSGHYHEYPDCYVADFECSVGVVGTGFWRAPEILEALKRRTPAADACSPKADVYSFAMTCYEVLTGLLPFEGQLMTNYDLVLSGHRPHLPDYIDPTVRALLLRCWDADPSKRPSFEKILKTLATLVDNLRLRSQGPDRIPFFGWRSSRTWYLDRYADLDPPLDSPPAP